MNSLEPKECGPIDQAFAIKANTLLLVVHVLYFAMFIMLEVYFMVFVNICSIAIYASAYDTVRKNLSHFLLKTYFEIVFHLCLSVFFVGFDYGFQLHCFSLIPVVFYFEYLSPDRTRSKHIMTLISSFVLMVIYLVLYLLFFDTVAFYPATNLALQKGIYIFNIILVFSFMIYFMYRYIKTSVETETALAEASTRDQLTKLCNRRNMLIYLDRSFLECTSKNQEMAVSILDIDDFKKVNDIYGHNAGDYVLREVASEILAYEKEYDIMTCRWGGEEFVLVMTGERSYLELKEKMQKLVETIANKTFTFDNINIPVTITAGIAKFRRDATIDALIARADSYLYEGKHNGKNQLVSKDG